MSVHTLRIDGADVAGAAGQSILDVATEQGIEIPTLCHLDGLSDVGACRLCVVEVGGSSKLLPACVTTVEEGMEVVAHSDRLAGYRRTLIEMLFVERNHICSVCVANNHCELQDLAAALGVPTSTCPRSTRGSAWTPATRCSPSTTTAASCAPAACASATRSRAPTPGT